MGGRFYSKHMHNTQFYHSYSYLGNSYSTTVQGVCVNATSHCLGPQFLSLGSSVYSLPLMYSSLTLHTAHKLLVIQYYFRLLSIFDSNSICLLVNLHGQGLLLSKHVLFSMQMFWPMTTWQLQKESHLLVCQLMQSFQRSLPILQQDTVALLALLQVKSLTSHHLGVGAANAHSSAS